MTRVKTIKENRQQRMYFRQNLQDVEDGGAINGEVGGALLSNGDRKEGALKGGFTVSMKVRV
jgi:hypothetical protein